MGGKSPHLFFFFPLGGKEAVLYVSEMNGYAPSTSSCCLVVVVDMRQRLTLRQHLHRFRAIYTVVMA